MLSRSYMDNSEREFWKMEVLQSIRKTKGFTPDLIADVLFNEVLQHMYGSAFERGRIEELMSWVSKPTQQLVKELHPMPEPKKRWWKR